MKWLKGKRKEYRIRLLGMVLAAAVGSLTVGDAGLQTFAAVTKNDVNAAKNKISALEQEKNNVEKTIKNLEGLKSDTERYVRELDTSLQELSNELADLEVKIGDKEEEIARTNEELEAAKVTEAEQYEAMKLRIQYMYEKGDTSYLEILMQADGMADLLNRAEYIAEITTYDRKQLDLYVQNKQAIAEHESALVAEREELLEFQEVTEVKQSSVETLIRKKTEEIKSYEAKLTDAERQASEHQKDILAQEAAIEKMEAEIKRQEEEARKKAEEEARKKAEEEARKKAEEEARKKAEEEARKKAEEEARKKAEAAAETKTVMTPEISPTTAPETKPETVSETKKEETKKTEQSEQSNKTESKGNTKFIWPCPSSSRITSSFGSRTSPTEGASSNHQGIDIGASSGSNIVASASGTVVISTYSYSAGNYIMINHGNGVYTVYMHCSKLLASVGDKVKQGEVIAKVGSTGYSTGPHLHFGVRVNGKYVNPRNYVNP